MAIDSLVLHQPTLLLLAAVLAAGLSAALLLAWRETGEIALGMWSLGYALLALGVAWLGVHTLPRMPAAAAALGFGVMLFGGLQWLAGARTFNRQRYPWPTIVATGAAWAAISWSAWRAGAIEPLHVAAYAALAGLVSLATAAVLLSERDKLLRWPVAGLLGALAAFHLVRAAALAGVVPVDMPADRVDPGLLVIVVLWVSVGFGVIVLAGERTSARLRRAVHHDSLTGALTRRELLLRADALLARMVRQRTVISILLLDVDHLKRINDTWGHGTGDRVLAAFAATVRAALRERDLFGRLGGEEFAVLLPHTGWEHARVIAERIRAAFERVRIEAEDGTTISTTVSIGISSPLVLSHNLALFLDEADKALYRAKRDGRNRVA